MDRNIRQIRLCIAPLYLSFPRVFQNPQVLHREMVFEMEHQRLGKIKQLGFPIKLSETPAQARLAPPDLGAHSSDILANLGYSKDDIQALREKGII